MLPDMLLSMDYELWKHDQACGTPVAFSQVPATARTRCTGLDCRALSWAGRVMVRWGLRLQERYAAPTPSHRRWATNGGR
jgi:hypothetical protein